MGSLNCKVSIITVVYNGADTIEQTIQSVLGQTYKNIEYIIIDGVSTDGTQEIIKKYLDYVDCYVSEIDDGIYDAMNKGVKYATGDVIAFLNSDDWYEEDAIQRVVSYFMNNELDIVMGGTNIVNNGYIQSVRKSDISVIKWETPCCHQAVFARKYVFNKIGNFNTKYQICADYDWILRAYNSKIHMECISDILVNYRLGGVSSVQDLEYIKEREEISTSSARKNNDEKLVWHIRDCAKKYREKRIKNRCLLEICENKPDIITRILGKDVSYYIWGTGYYGKICFKVFHAAKVSIKGFIDNNVNGGMLYGIPIISPDKIRDDVNICIATFKYEEEIIQQIGGMQKKNKYICWSKLVDKIVQYQRKD